MSEARLWAYLRGGMGPLWEAQRHEDRHTVGIPDVSYSTNVHGWIELKYLAAAPKKGGVMRLRHFTPQQRNWLTKHGARGGGCFVLLQVGREYMLLPWDSCPAIGNTDLAGHIAASVGHWRGGINWGQLAQLLSRGKA